MAQFLWHQVPCASVSTYLSVINLLPVTLNFCIIKFQAWSVVLISLFDTFLCFNHDYGIPLCDSNYEDSTYNCWSLPVLSASSHYTVSVLKKQTTTKKNEYVVLEGI